MATKGKAAPKPRRHILLRLGPYSLRLGVRSLVVALALLVLLTVVAVASISTGAYPVSPAQVSAAIFGYGQEDNYARYFVTQVRAPRIATAMLVGLLWACPVPCSRPYQVTLWVAPTLLVSPPERPLAPW